MVEAIAKQFRRIRVAHCHADIPHEVKHIIQFLSYPEARRKIMIRKLWFSQPLGIKITDYKIVKHSFIPQAFPARLLVILLCFNMLKIVAQTGFDYKAHRESIEDIAVTA